MALIGSRGRSLLEAQRVLLDVDWFWLYTRPAECGPLEECHRKWSSGNNATDLAGYALMTTRLGLVLYSRNNNNNNSNSNNEYI